MQDIMNLDDQQSRLKLLIAKGKEQGYLTYAEVNDHLPEGIVDTEQIEDIVSMINDMGITVHEVAPDADDLLMMETEVNTDEGRGRRGGRGPRHPGRGVRAHHRSGADVHA